jgi:hypothetical protein
MKKKIYQPNQIIGYDDKGNITMAYWQKEPIETRKGMLFSIPWYMWWNPVWRFRQWRMLSKPITFSDSFFGKTK